MAAAFFAAFFFFLPDSGYDKYFWVNWTEYITNQGLLNVYNNPEVGYPPVVLFCCWVFTWFADAAGAINQVNINYLKLPALIADWTIIFLAIKLLQKNNKPLQWALLLVFNPVFWYNSLVWGQFDSMYVAPLAWGIYYLVDKKATLATMLFALAVLTKLQALLLVLPILGLYIYNAQKASRIKLSALFLVTVALPILAFIPFTGVSISTILNRTVNYYTGVSQYAYNVWYFIFDNPVATPATTTFIGNTTLSTWGLYIAMLGGVGAMSFLVNLKIKNTQQLFAAFAMASLAYFFFMAKMHERYAHPAIVFVLIAFVCNPYNKPLGVVALLVCLAYGLNLEAVMQFTSKGFGFALNYSAWYFSPIFVATLYATALFMLVYILISTANRYSKQDGTVL